MQQSRGKTCCFSGYRIEKMPFDMSDSAAVSALCALLTHTIEYAAAQGYTRFISGMSTGFDLWAAEAVLQLRAQFPIQLLCAVPFDDQAAHFPLYWQRLFNRCLLSADKVYALSHHYYTGCFAARNRFMIDASSLLICYHDGKPGGTAQTIHMAEQQGLAFINLAKHSAFDSK